MQDEAAEGKDYSSIYFSMLEDRSSVISYVFYVGVTSLQVCHFEGATSCLCPALLSSLIFNKMLPVSTFLLSSRVSLLLSKPKHSLKKKNNYCMTTLISIWHANIRVNVSQGKKTFSLDSRTVSRMK